MSKKYFILLFLFAGSFAQAQKLKKEDRQLIANLQQHIHYLADDKLEGRRTGTEGEKLAAAYISKEFQQIGLTPKGTNEFYQPFNIDEGKQINPTTQLVINGKTLELNKDFFPLAYSPNNEIESQPSVALEEPGMPWFFNIKDLLEENAGNPHFNSKEAIAALVKEAKKKGATAIFIYNTSARNDELKFDAKDKSETPPIPIVYVTKNAAKKYFSDESATLDVKLKIDIGEKIRTGTNVLGYIDNNAPTTIIVGAHFDHLGYGEDYNSRYTGTTPQIHNGADDNASGTAALIELARLLKASKYKNNNYLFIAFSGEELGLFGSKYFISHPTINLANANFMVNMDMVGRLNDSTHVVTVGGYGTSPSWGQIYNLKGRKKLYEHNLVFHFDSSGTGPSDHTSFYLKNIPVLFYFTGLHADYHKPTDDYDKINFTGEMDVVKHILSVIETEDRQKSKLVFLKTREAQTTTDARFSVTLGIMPDYTFAGTGVRIDGVSEDKPAQKAGLKTGDVIIFLGGYKTETLERYMQALGKFSKGDKATVVYNRGSQTLSSVVQF